ncbi:collagen, type I, alpha 1b-like [Macaca nemestrina]|uniref:collagen, type I, alpha 1b-like n=1 Tax=Macaca nemestrina TaxID=9545 RepID=UPI0039B9BD96
MDGGGGGGSSHGLAGLPLMRSAGRPGAARGGSPGPRGGGGTEAGGGHPARGFPRARGSPGAEAGGAAGEGRATQALRAPTSSCSAGRSLVGAPGDTPPPFPTRFLPDGHGRVYAGWKRGRAAADKLSGWGRLKRMVEELHPSQTSPPHQYQKKREDSGNTYPRSVFSSSPPPISVSYLDPFPRVGIPGETLVQPCGSCHSVSEAQALPRPVSAGRQWGNPRVGWGGVHWDPRPGCGSPGGLPTASSQYPLSSACPG